MSYFRKLKHTKEQSLV